MPVISCNQTISALNKRIRSSKIGTRFVSGAFWTILGNVFGKGLMLVAFIVVARLIGQEKYGEFGMIRSTIVMFSFFSGAGLGYTASRYIALYRNTEPQKMHEVYLLSWYFSIGLGILFALLLCFFAPVIAERSLHTSELTNDIRLGAAVLFFITLSSVQTGVLQGFEQFKIIATNAVFFGIIQLLCLLFGAYFFNISGIIFGMGLSYFSLCLLNQWYIKKNISNITFMNCWLKKLSKETLSILWKFSLPVVMLSSLIMPVLWWCKTMVVKFNGFEAIANYDVGEQWSSVILFIPVSLTGIIVPMLSNTLSEGTAEQYKKLIKINVICSTLITVLASSGVLLLSSFILKTYGEGFTDKRTFMVLVLSTIPNAIAAVFGNTIISKGKTWVGFTLNIFWAIWVIVFFLIFVYKMNYGAFGFALAILISYILHVFTSCTYVWVTIIKSH